MSANGGGGAKKSAFRCLDAARYAVAAVVTVVIVGVIVKAIWVVFRAESLELTVVGGSVSAAPAAAPPAPPAVAIGLSLRAQNPSGRVRMYYLSITGYLFDGNTSAATANPDDDSIALFRLKDVAATQQEAVDADVHLRVDGRSMTGEYLALLYGGGRMSEVTLRLDGRLVNEVRSGFNKSSLATYYCEQLVVGGSPGEEEARPDVICKESAKGI
ncbi:hypothetical protein ACP4OV_017318 [Aristida adscensionis]